MFTEALFTIAKRWKQLKSSLMDEWLNKMWSICTLEYYSALKRKKILTPATKWMNLEGVMLSKISKSRNNKYCMIPLTSKWGICVCYMPLSQPRLLVILWMSDVHSARSPTLLPGSCRLMPMASFSESVDLILVFLFSCCFLFSQHCCLFQRTLLS